MASTGLNPRSGLAEDDSTRDSHDLQSIGGRHLNWRCETSARADELCAADARAHHSAKRRINDAKVYHLAGNIDTRRRYPQFPLAISAVWPAASKAVYLTDLKQGVDRWASDLDEQCGLSSFLAEPRPAGLLSTTRRRFAACLTATYRDSYGRPESGRPVCEASVTVGDEAGSGDAGSILDAVKTAKPAFVWRPRNLQTLTSTSRCRGSATLRRRMVRRCTRLLSQHGLRIRRAGVYGNVNKNNTPLMRMVTRSVRLF